MKIIFLIVVVLFGCTKDADILSEVQEVNCCDSLAVYSDSLQFYKELSAIYLDSLYMFKPEVCDIDSTKYWWFGDPWPDQGIFVIYMGCNEPDSIFDAYKYGYPPSAPMGIPGSEE